MLRTQCHSYNLNFELKIVAEAEAVLHKKNNSPKFLERQIKRSGVGLLKLLPQL